MDASDEALLQQYAREGSNPAFTELVRRHIDLVYSCARRQLNSESLAADVTQSVFIDLARAANSLKPSQPVVAWLHVVTRRTAVDYLRREMRRQAREQVASELATMNPPSSTWLQVEPLLDEAMEALDELDRQALLLRFLESKSLREVGAALGTSDDAAQKRVSRALEHLRAILMRRGAIVSAAGLATDLSAHTLLSAPAGLITSIAMNIMPATGLATASTLTQGAAMTSLNKVLIAVIATLAAGFVLQSHWLAEQSRRLASLELQTQESNRSLRELRALRAQSKARLTAARAELSATNQRRNEATAVETGLEQWLQRVQQLENWLGRMPEKSIPEMSFLSSRDWLRVTINNPLETETEAREALKELRLLAKNKPQVRGNLSQALRSYLKDHSSPPTTVDSLKPYLNPALPDDVLQRYEIPRPQAGPPTASYAESGWSSGITKSLLREKVAVDEDFDTLLWFSARATGQQYVSKLGTQLRQAEKTFVEANPGQKPVRADQLLPYITGPAETNRLQELLDLRQSVQGTPSL